MSQRCKIVPERCIACGLCAIYAPEIFDYDEDVEINQEALPVYEALASNVRIKIIQLLAKNKMNVKELAQELGLSSAIVTMHIKKLEEAKIIKTERGDYRLLLRPTHESRCWDRQIPLSLNTKVTHQVLYYQILHSPFVRPPVF